MTKKLFHHQDTNLDQQSKILSTAQIKMGSIQAHGMMDFSVTYQLWFRSPTGFDSCGVFKILLMVTGLLSLIQIPLVVKHQTLTCFFLRRPCKRLFFVTKILCFIDNYRSYLSFSSISPLYSSVCAAKSDEIIIQTIRP